MILSKNPRGDWLVLDGDTSLQINHSESSGFNCILAKPYEAPIPVVEPEEAVGRSSEWIISTLFIAKADLAFDLGVEEFELTADMAYNGGTTELTTFKSDIALKPTDQSLLYVLADIYSEMRGEFYVRGTLSHTIEGVLALIQGKLQSRKEALRKKKQLKKQLDDIDSI